MAKRKKLSHPTLTKVMAKRRKQSHPTLTLTPLQLSNSLPFDLVVEILCRLSMKHLLQLRCICKSWNSLISRDSNFAKKQFRFSTSIQDRHHLILSSPKLLLSHSPISSIFTSPIATVKQFGYGKRSILNKIQPYGNRASTCDGILCFKIHDTSALVCNPFVRKFKKLPLLKFPLQCYNCYTLVHDRFTNNYKVIAVNLASRKKEVSIHTLGTHYWRRILDFPGPHLNPMYGSGTFVNDCVNWLTSDHACNEFLIVSLDLEKESYQKFSLPVFDVEFPTSCSSILGTLKGCLSLLSERDNYYDVLIMKEYGNEKSWNKLLRIPNMNLPDFFGYINVFYISEDNQVLMEFQTKDAGFNLRFNYVVYDSINNTFKVPEFQNNIHGKMVAQEVCVESLIYPF